MALVKVQYDVWYNADAGDVGAATDAILSDVNEYDGVEFVRKHEPEPSAGTYDEERGCWVIPNEEIGERGEFE